MRAPTLRAALGESRARLAAAGCDSPGLDAEVLLAHVLGADRAQLVVRGRDPLPEASAPAYEALVARRERREPVAYLTGGRAFRFLELTVDRRVLIPRPETELLVEAALGLPRGAGVLDVGTGSGAVALALKHERPDLRVLGTDVDPRALAVARENAERLGLDVELQRADGLAGIEAPLDAVVSNPPYVADADRRHLAPEIASYEPAGALFAGADGLAVLRGLVSQIAARRVPWVAFEVGDRQASVVAGLLAHAGYRHVERLRDLSGRERVVRARR